MKGVFRPERSLLPTVAGMFAFLLFGSGISRHAQAQIDDFEREPIQYSKAQADNCITQLQAQIDAGEVELKFEPHFGYLRSVLDALKIPVDSQTLVFSKTSLQRQRIAPRTPRALYFGDDAYIGFCQKGEVVEVSAVDPKLGTVFYTLPQKVAERPKFLRQGDNCLICHGSSQTLQVPGHMIRSVYPDGDGHPILASGTYRVDHSTPLAHRWGGWYVTGEHGDQKHLGNLIIRGRETPESVDNSAGQNVLALDQFFDVGRYLTPHSDILALMVLEHQAMGHNLLTQANFATQMALHHEAELNRELGEAPDHRWNSTNTRIRSAGDALVKYLLCSGEAALSAPLRGNTQFAAQFAARGPRDPHGRSLRDLDATRRLFRYPCSYLVYTPAFDTLPAEMRTYVLDRMLAVLTGQDTAPEFAHLTSEDRQAILEILRATKPNLPDNWRS